MQLAEILNALRPRLVFTQAKDYLAAIGAPTAIGWDATINACVSARPPLGPVVVQQLQAVLLQSYIVSRKSFALYDLSPTHMKRLRGAKNSWVASPNPFSSAFPLPAHNLLAPNLPGLNEWLPTATVDGDGGFGLILSAIRTFDRRTDVDYSTFPKQARDALDKYDELIGVESVRVQVFDAIWVPDSGGRIAILVDHPEGAGKAFSAKSHAAAKKQAEDALGIDLMPVDLFDAISGIYGAKSEGLVVELGFATDTAGVKSSKMRRHGTCVRKDVFQKGGELAVNNQVSPYRISVRWTLKKSPRFNVEPELTIEGRAMMLSKASGLYRGFTDKLWDTSDIGFIMTKLSKYV